jgi:hypothetical protein
MFDSSDGNSWLAPASLRFFISFGVLMAVSPLRRGLLQGLFVGVHNFVLICVLLLELTCQVRSQHGSHERHLGQGRGLEAKRENRCMVNDIQVL